MAKAWVPYMITAGRGRIINIASVAAYYWQIPAMIPADGGLGSWAYNQSKWGLVALSRILAAQLGQHGITSNCIAPGVTSTAATDKQVPVDFQHIFTALSP
jgi:3-oxoacyl-[acyl-carrier protein] reductase